MDAASIVSREMIGRPKAERGSFLRELLAHVAAGLVVTCGSREAAEAIFRLADAVVSREEASPLDLKRSRS